MKAEQENGVDRLSAVVPGATVELDEVTGSPKFIRSSAGYLSGPNGQGVAISAGAAKLVAANDPDRAVKAFLNEYSGVFGHGADALASARVKRQYTTAQNGLRTSVWEQHLDGIPVFQGVLVSHTTRNGELVNVSSRFVANAKKAADAGTPNRLALQGAPSITSQQAIVNAAKAINVALSATQVVSVSAKAPPPDRKSTRLNSSHER